MSNFPLLQYRALDANGDPISGAKLNFYESGTTTRQATYSDRALATPNTNPMAANGDGWFDIIYMGSSAYKVVLTDANDVVIWSEDDVYALQDTQLATRVRQIALTPLDYGAIGDGAADESSEVQSALDNASSVVDLLGLTFRCDSQITVPDGVTLKNGTLDFSNRGSVTEGHILIEGATDTSASATTTGAGDTTITSSLSGASAGDWCILESNAVWSGSQTIGELVKIESVSAGVITVAQHVLTEYAFADSAQLTRVNMSKGQVLSNLTVLGNASGNGYGIECIFGAEVLIENCIIKDMLSYSITLHTSADVVIRDCVTEGSSICGVQIDDGCRACTVDGLSASDSAGVIVTSNFDKITLDSVVRNIRVGRGVSSIYGGVQASYNTAGTLFSDIVVHSLPVILDGPRTSLANATIRGSEIQIGPELDTLDFPGPIEMINLQLHDCYITAEQGFSLSNSVLYDGSLNYLLKIEPPSGDVAEVRISNCKITSINPNANRVIYGAGSGSIDLHLANCLIEADTCHGIEGTTFRNMTITGTKIECTGATGSTIEATASGTTILSGCELISASQTERGLYLTTTSGALIMSGCRCEHLYDFAIQMFDFVGYDQSAISGCVFIRTGTTASCVKLTGSDSFSFSGNVVINGTYGLEASGGSNILSDGNVYIGQATGNTTGAAITNGDEL